MLKLRLTDVDREKYGGPEWLDWDENRLTEGESELLQENVGVAWTAYPTWLGDGGTKAIKWALWVSLRRAGVEMSWAAFDPDILGVRVDKPEPVAEPAAEGKAPRRSTRPRRSAASAKN